MMFSRGCLHQPKLTLVKCGVLSIGAIQTYAGLKLMFFLQYKFNQKVLKPNKPRLFARTYDVWTH